MTTTNGEDSRRIVDLDTVCYMSKYKPFFIKVMLFILLHDEKKKTNRAAKRLQKYKISSIK